MNSSPKNSVIPAKAGIQCVSDRLATLDPGFRRGNVRWLGCVLLALVIAAPASAQPSGIDSTLDPGLEAAPAPVYPDGYPALAGTRWRLLRYIRVDGGTLVPSAPDQFTIAFAPDGTAALHLDCNRATGAWSADASGSLRLGPLAATEAACPDMALHDRILADAPEVRGYLVEDNRLWLALTPGGGVYEFEPGAP